MKEDIHNYYMDIACLEKEKSTCARRGVGAVIVKNNMIIGKGYNHTVKGSMPCTEDTCIRKINNITSGTRQEYCMAIHAEQSAIIDAYKNGYNTENSTIYITDSPCVICARLICEFGITKVYYKDSYPDELSFKILNNASIDIYKINNNKVKKKVKKMDVI